MLVCMYGGEYKSTGQTKKKPPQKKQKQKTKREEVDQAINSFQCFLRDCSTNIKGSYKNCENTGFLAPSFLPSLLQISSHFHLNKFLRLSQYVVRNMLELFLAFMVNLAIRLKPKLFYFPKIKTNYRFVLFEEPVCSDAVICL